MVGKSKGSSVEIDDSIKGDADGATVHRLPANDLRSSTRVADAGAGVGVAAIGRSLLSLRRGSRSHPREAEPAYREASSLRPAD
jgi:hypothetical protein